MSDFYSELNRLTNQSVLDRMMQRADDIMSRELELPMRHHLKTVQPFFNQVCSGRKTVEVRYNDRDFKQDDLLILKEYDPETDTYTGEEIVVHVTNILTDFEGLVDGWAAMSIHIVEDE